MNLDTEIRADGRKKLELRRNEYYIGTRAQTNLRGPVDVHAWMNQAYIPEGEHLWLLQEIDPLILMSSYANVVRERRIRERT